MIVELLEIVPGYTYECFDAVRVLVKRIPSLRRRRWLPTTPLPLSPFFSPLLGGHATDVIVKGENGRQERLSAASAHPDTAGGAEPRRSRRRGG